MEADLGTRRRVSRDVVPDFEEPGLRLVRDPVDFSDREDLVFVPLPEPPLLKDLLGALVGAELVLEVVALPEPPLLKVLLPVMLFVLVVFDLYAIDSSPYLYNLLYRAEVGSKVGRQGRSRAHLLH